MSGKKGGVLETPPDEELAIVCENGNADRVSELLAFGVDPNGRHDERSYLSIAARNGHQVVVLRLIKAGAKVYRSHLLEAIRGGNARCADRLWDELHYDGTEVDLDHDASELLYQRKVAASLTPEMFQWLHRNGVDLSAPDRLGRTIREIAKLDGARQELLDALDALTDG
jgi:hypothetical protein